MKLLAVLLEHTDSSGMNLPSHRKTTKIYFSRKPISLQLSVTQSVWISKRCDLDSNCKEM